IIEQNLHMITLECLPKDLPTSIELDISGLKIGGVLLVKDVPALSGVKFVTHEDVPVVSCNYKSEDKPAEAPAEPAADAAAAAPAADAKKADAAKK
ncbi:MAG: 50S ribosomal protein L25, partial [Planctomycetes bacterium]|nr:50S ribosomal protein L25 [Planctomycetota bacterium]